MDEEGREVFYCVVGGPAEGHSWKLLSMPYYDKLPADIRQQLSRSPFNICSMCFGGKVKDIKRLHPEWPRKKLLSAAIKVIEHQIRNSQMGKVVTK